MAPCITFRYQQLLTECHQCYFTQRELLLSSSVAGSITELSVTHKGDHCSLVRSSCAFLVHVCHDEHQLFYQFFSQPTPLLTWVHFLEIFQPAVCVLLFLQFYLSKCHISAADWTDYEDWQMTRKLVTFRVKAEAPHSWFQNIYLPTPKTGSRYFFSPLLGNILRFSDKYRRCS